MLLLQRIVTTLTHESHLDTLRLISSVYRYCFAALSRDQRVDGLSEELGYMYVRACIYTFCI